MHDLIVKVVKYIFVIRWHDVENHMNDACYLVIILKSGVPIDSINDRQEFNNCVCKTMTHESNDSTLITRLRRIPARLQKSQDVFLNLIT